MSRRGWTLLQVQGDNLVVARNKQSDEYFLLIYGTDYRAAIKAFFELAEAPPLVPRWSLGVWYSRFQPYKPKDYHDTTKGFRSRGIGLDALVLDMNWHSDSWFGLEYNKERFGNMQDFFDWAKENDLNLIFNHHPGAVEKADPRTPALLKRLGLNEETATTYKTDNNFFQTDKFPVWKIDYKDPKVFPHYYDLMLKPLQDDGVKIHWIDGGPGIPTMKLYYDRTQKYAGDKRVAILTRQHWGEVCSTIDTPLRFLETFS